MGRRFEVYWNFVANNYIKRLNAIVRSFFITKNRGGVFSTLGSDPMKLADERTEKQKVQEITDKLEEGLKELFESEKYKAYLSTMSKFHNYSFNNTLLIAMQKPEATLVAGYKAWQKNFERHVNKGEKAIRILAC